MAGGGHVMRIAWLAPLLFFPLEIARAGDLFVLERTTNRNRLVYEADLSSPSDPVRPYWKMLETDGHEEPLTALERNQFYGVAVSRRAEGEVDFSFRALPALMIHVRERNGSPAAFANLAGGERRIRGFFLRLGGGLFPSLQAVEAECSDDAGHPVRFAFTPGDATWRELP